MSFASLFESAHNAAEHDESPAVKCPDCGQSCSSEHVCPDCGRCTKCQESYRPTVQESLNEMAKIADTGTKVNCPNMSFPPVISCKHDSPCRNGGCYGCASVARFKGFAENAAANYEQWNSAPEQFEKELDGYLQFKHPDRFRYQVAGDVPDEAFLAMTARQADKHPETKFLMYSKRHDLDLGKYRRPNLAILRSMWPKWGTPDAAHPQAWMKDEAGEEDRIPADSFKCPCGPTDPGCGVPFPNGDKPCTKCWDLKPGENVHFEQHGTPTKMDTIDSAPEGKHKNWKNLVKRFGKDTLAPTPITPFKPYV